MRSLTLILWACAAVFALGFMAVLLAYPPAAFTLAIAALVGGVWAALR